LKIWITQFYWESILHQRINLKKNKSNKLNSFRISKKKAFKMEDQVIIQKKWFGILFIFISKTNIIFIRVFFKSIWTKQYNIHKDVRFFIIFLFILIDKLRNEQFFYFPILFLKRILEKWLGISWILSAFGIIFTMIINWNIQIHFHLDYQTKKVDRIESLLHSIYGLHIQQIRR
jgi:hypothetical protein